MRILEKFVNGKIFADGYWEVAVGHGGLTPRLRLAPQVLRSYPCPLVR